MSQPISSCLWDTKLKLWYEVTKRFTLCPWSKHKTLYLYLTKTQAQQKCDELNDSAAFGYRYSVQSQSYPTYPDNTIDWSYQQNLNAPIPVVQVEYKTV
jgi:hypothetical protein